MGIFRKSRDRGAAQGPDDARGPAPDRKGDANESPESIKVKQDETNHSLEIGESETEPYFEKSNRGVRVTRLPQATTFWEETEASPDSISFAAYVFDTELSAMDALLSLSYVHEAADTGNPVCSSNYFFGCYRRSDGKYEVIAAGKDMSKDHWREAREAFCSAGGALDQEKGPGKAKADRNVRRVEFVREYSRVDLTESNYYKVYKSPDPITAKSFLNDPSRRVSRKNYIILVQTPEGDFYRDFFGVHEGQSKKDS